MTECYYSEVLVRNSDRFDNIHSLLPVYCVTHDPIGCNVTGVTLSVIIVLPINYDSDPRWLWWHIYGIACLKICIVRQEIHLRSLLNHAYRLNYKYNFFIAYCKPPSPPLSIHEYFFEFRYVRILHAKPLSVDDVMVNNLLYISVQKSIKSINIQILLLLAFRPHAFLKTMNFTQLQSHFISLIITYAVNPKHPHDFI